LIGHCDGIPCQQQSSPTNLEGLAAFDPSFDLRELSQCGRPRTAIAVASAGSVSTTVAQRNRPCASYPWKDEPKRWSARIFGEYAFIEDSRYTSQVDSTGGCQQRDNSLLRNRYFGLLLESG
jgi:hypothetical protein